MKAEAAGNNEQVGTPVLRPRTAPDLAPDGFIPPGMLPPASTLMMAMPPNPGTVLGDGGGGGGGGGAQEEWDESTGPQDEGASEGE